MAQEANMESAISEAVAEMNSNEAKEFLNKMSILYKIDTLEQMTRERDRLKEFYTKQKDKDRRLLIWVTLMAKRLERSGNERNLSYAKQLRDVLEHLCIIDLGSRRSSSLKRSEGDDGVDDEKVEEESDEIDITDHPGLDDQAIAVACEGLGRTELYAVEHQLHRMQDLHDAEEIERQMRNMTTMIKQLYRRDTRMLQCMQVLGRELQDSGDQEMWVSTYMCMTKKCGIDEQSIGEQEQEEIKKNQPQLSNSTHGVDMSNNMISSGISMSRSLTNLFSRRRPTR
eukprot:CFRG7309T1